MDLLTASLYGDLDRVICLLATQINVDSQDQLESTAFMFAAGNGRDEIASRLLDAGADVNHRNKYGNSALTWASQYGHNKIMERLLDAGADVNHKNTFERTALSIADKNTNVNILRYFHLSKIFPLDIVDIFISTT